MQVVLHPRELMALEGGYSCLTNIIGQATKLCTCTNTTIYDGKNISKTISLDIIS